MTRTSAHRPILFRSIAVGLLAVVSLPCAAVAQDAGENEKEKEEQVVVLNVHTESTTMPWTRESAAEFGALPVPDVGSVTNSVMSLFLQAFGALHDMGVPRDLLSEIGNKAARAGLKLEKAYEGRGPKTETMDYVVHIRPEEFRLNAQGFTMVWRAGEMKYTDPRTGKLRTIDLNWVNSEVAERRAIHHDGMQVDPMPGAQTKGVAGRLTRGYEYNYTMGVGSESQPTATVEVEGEAWIASNLPEGEQIATFYRNFASAFGDEQSMMGGQTAGMARLAEIGVPLETTDTSSVYMMRVGESGEIVPLGVRRTVSTTTVTSISTVPLSELEEEAPPPDLEEPQVLGSQPPDEPEPEPCDCSCEAFAALQDLDEDDPDAMGKAMCAQQCMAKFVGCAKP